MTRSLQLEAAGVFLSPGLAKLIDAGMADVELPEGVERIVCMAGMNDAGVPKPNRHERRSIAAMKRRRK